VANLAAKFGLPRPGAYPALALGTGEVTPLEIAAAYAAFANGGNAVTPTVIRRVIDGNTGEILVDEQPGTRQVIKATTAYMITDILSEVLKRGTGQRAKGNFRNVAVAGKTGTSRDGWFVGYTPNLVCAVWIGFDDNKQLGLTGADAALPAWIEFMKAALAIRPSLGGTIFKKPSGILTVKVDPETGVLAGPNCPSSMSVSVSYNYAPSVECLKHALEPEAYEPEMGVLDQIGIDSEFDGKNVDTLENEGDGSVDRALDKQHPDDSSPETKPKSTLDN
jgi:penicillin-binding protein 1B